MLPLPIVSLDDAAPRPAVTGDPPAGVKGTYAFISLGCPKNLVDTERMLGLLQLDGYHMVQQPEQADLVVVNTCGFIERARAESYAAIDEMLALKRTGKTRGVIVAGCLAEREQASLLETHPEIDHLVGVFGREEITRVADRLLGGLEEQRMVFTPAPIRALSDRQRMRVTPRHFAYLKISEGCDRLCTFCAIPKMRGKHASKLPEEILAEARELAADGVKELVIVAQDTTYYGMDLNGEPQLESLLAELEQVDGIEWIRLMYLYPIYFHDRLIERIARSKKILPYLDLPLQHINDTMLKRMQRKVTRAETEALLKKLRTSIPQLTLRTTLITGFPGETEAQYAELKSFVREQRFERLGVFTYSYEPNTPSAKLPDQIPEAIKLERRDELMAIQQELAFAWGQAQIGRKMDVLLDLPVPGEAEALMGRGACDAPEVDATVYVSGKGLQPGQIVPCEIVATSGYDLVAAALNRESLAAGPEKAVRTRQARGQGGKHRRKR